jgi:hypothetical protein
MRGGHYLASKERSPPISAVMFCAANHTTRKLFAVAKRIRSRCDLRADVLGSLDGCRVAHPSAASRG